MFTDAIIPIRKLDRSRDHEFAFAPDEAQISAMLAENDWRNLQNIKIAGVLCSRDEGWELEARLTGTLSLTCVISGAPIHQPLSIAVRRFYQNAPEDLPPEMSWDMDYDVDIEPMPQNLDLVALISESIELEAPDYPKLPKYSADETGAPWQYDEDDQPVIDTQRPFADLKTMLERKKSS